MCVCRSLSLLPWSTRKEEELDHSRPIRICCRWIDACTAEQYSSEMHSYFCCVGAEKCRDVSLFLSLPLSLSLSPAWAVCSVFFLFCVKSWCGCCGVFSGWPKKDYCLLERRHHFSSGIRKIIVVFACLYIYIHRFLPYSPSEKWSLPSLCALRLQWSNVCVDDFLILSLSEQSRTPDLSVKCAPFKSDLAHQHQTGKLLWTPERTCHAPTALPTALTALVPVPDLVNKVRANKRNENTEILLLSHMNSYTFLSC